ncbi:MAG: DUF6511 domain-containing protein [Alphaproteobacteria bacterium]
MIDKTPLEEAAIKAARRPLAEVLQELGLLVALPSHPRWSPFRGFWASL